MRIQEIYQAIDAFIPFQTQDDFDNSGFLFGSMETRTSGVLFSLDLSKTVIQQAVENDIRLIVTHHPFIFHPLTSVVFEEAKGKMVKMLVENDISVISAHTNLDKSPWGISCVLAELIGMDDSEILVPDEKFPNIGYGRIGTLKIKGSELVDLLKQKTRASNLILYNVNPEILVETVALCGGSGCDFLEYAKKRGAELYITGDVKYHDAEHATDIGLGIIDLGHFYSEYLGFKYLVQHLLSLFPFLGIQFYDKPYSSIIFS